MLLNRVSAASASGAVIVLLQRQLATYDVHVIDTAECQYFALFLEYVLSVLLEGMGVCPKSANAAVIHCCDGSVCQSSSSCCNPAKFRGSMSYSPRREVQTSPSIFIP